MTERLYRAITVNGKEIFALQNFCDGSLTAAGCTVYDNNAAAVTDM